MAKKLLALTLVLVMVAGFTAMAAEKAEETKPLSGSWTNTLTLKPQTAAFTGYSSTVDIDYTAGGVDYNVSASLSGSGLSALDFGMEAELGVVTLDSTVSFDTQTPGLEYWKTAATFNFGGIAITDTFVLQSGNWPTYPNHDYGSGMALELSGNLSDTVSVTVTNLFGMEADTSCSPGSGYDIVVQTGYAPSSLQYVSTEVEVSGMTLGCVDYTATTTFSEAKGFENTTFEFDVTSTNWPLELAADLKFTPQTKSISLTPSLTTEWACLEVYTDLTGTLAKNSTTKNTLTGLEVEGFALSGVKLGHVEFSSKTDLSGDLYYSGSHIGLHAMDYSVTSLACGTKSNYDEVFSLVKSDEDMNMGVDFYFDMSDTNTSSGGLFDLALFTANGTLSVTDQFDVGGGVSVDPSTGGGLNQFEIYMDYYF